MRAPSSCSITDTTPSMPRSLPPTCCQAGRNRPRVAWSTGATSCRRAARGRRAEGARALLDHRHPTGDAAQLAAHVLPGGQEPAESGLVDGFDLVPQRRERPAAQAPQHLGVAPFAAAAVRSEFALDDAAG